MKHRIFCAIFLLGLFFGAPNAQELKTIYSIDGIEWIAETDYAAAKLVVAGPDGFRRELAFKPGDSLYMDYSSLGLKALSDGVYKYELQFSANPMLAGADAKLVGEMRAEGKDVSFAAAPTLGGATGSFSVSGGRIIDRDLVEQVNEKTLANQKDQQILDDLIVDGSICAGLDCVNGESFGFDTLRLKENNLRIRFFDTSSSASFPTRDWQLTANDSSNGGKNKFSIDDIDGGRTPFTIEADARSHALYVDSGGDIGIGTSTPVADIHVKTGNTPTLRLEQDGSSGFGAQTWDVAGNEANFFIRDATNGSTLPFRIFPGAPSNAIYLANDGDVGFNKTAPAGESQVHILSNGSNRQVLTLERAGNVGIVFDDNTATNDWTFGTDAAGNLNIAVTGGLGVLLQISGTTGNITCPTSSTINGQACTGL